MFSVPVTYLFDFDTVGADRPERRLYFLREFAANGAKHLVLTDTLIKYIMAEPGLEDELLREMASCGLDFVDSHAPFHPHLDLSCPLAEYRGSITDRLRLSLRIANYMGVDTMTVHVGNDHWMTERLPVSTYVDCAKRRLEEILPTAEALGVTVCIENIWFATNTPDVLNEIKAAFPTDALGFCYDAGHANLMARGRLYEDSAPRRHWAQAGRGEPVWEDRALEKMLPDVVNCHLHDNDGRDDRHWNVGRGNIDWNHIIPLLTTAPRLKCIQSEVIIAHCGSTIRETVAAFEKLGELA